MPGSQLLLPQRANFGKREFSQPENERRQCSIPNLGQKKESLMSEATLLVRFLRFFVRALMCVQPAKRVQKAGVPLGCDSTDILLMSPNL